MNREIIREREQVRGIRNYEKLLINREINQELEQIEWKHN